MKDIPDAECFVRGNLLKQPEPDTSWKTVVRGNLKGALNCLDESPPYVGGALWRVRDALKLLKEKGD